MPDILDYHDLQLMKADDKYQILLDLTRQVRAAQKSYFRTRTSETLAESKRLEKQLDELIKEQPTTAQIDLF